MASLRERNGNWYARVRRYDRNHKRHEKEVPLRTASKTEADARFREVVRVEPEIKNTVPVVSPQATKQSHPSHAPHQPR